MSGVSLSVLRQTLPMANVILSDGEAKDLLRTKWKEITGKDKGFPTSFEGSRWVRVLPKPSSGRSSTARLLKAGELVGRHPDGLYAVVGSVGGELVADVVAIEVCRTLQNFETKRHTYGDRSLRLELDAQWLRETRKVSRQTKHLWEWLGFPNDPGTAAGASKVRVPVRLASVLYVLPESFYRSIKSGVVPYANEFFCKMSSLGSWDAQGYKNFLRALTWDDQSSRTFYTRA